MGNLDGYADLVGETEGIDVERWVSIRPEASHERVEAGTIRTSDTYARYEPYERLRNVRYVEACRNVRATQLVYEWYVQSVGDFDGRIESEGVLEGTLGQEGTKQGNNRETNREGEIRVQIWERDSKSYNF